MSTYNHLVVSWIREWGKTLDRPNGLVPVNWECLEEAPNLEIFNSHLQQSFSAILVDFGDIEPLLKLLR